MPRNVELGTSPSSHQQPKSNKCPKQEEDKDLDWLHQTRSHAQSDLPRPGHQEQQHHLHASQDDNEEEELKQQATVATRQQQQEHPVSLADNFQVLSNLGSGTFADVYKVRSKTDGKLYAIKRNRRQFRGKRDREAALTEVRCLQQLQSKTPQSSYVLRFFQAWQEDGYFFCQTELCCRDTCRELIDSVRTNWEMARTRYPCLANNRFFPIPTLFKILHDTVAGLAHIHKHGMTHFDIKPGNIFLVPDDTLGAVCKIGDFGLARTIGNSEDGREGDQKYMALELLQENTRAHPSADIFSLGLTMYEMAHTDVAFFVPAEGPRWHELRNGNVKAKEFIAHPELASAIASMMHPDPNLRPSAEQILYRDDVKTAGNAHNAFLAEYIRDVETFDLARQEQMERIMAMEPTDQQETPRNLVPSSRIFASPPPYKMMTSTMIPSSPPPPPPLWYHHRHPSSSSSPTPAADPVQP
jgi:serine/threonine protein kinase